jgi:hypothetical protein
MATRVLPFVGKRITDYTPSKTSDRPSLSATDARTIA